MCIRDRRKEVLAVERFFIRKYKPPFNVAENSKSREQHCQELQRRSELYRINEARLCLQDERNNLSRSRVLMGDEVIKAVSTGMPIYQMTCYTKKGAAPPCLFVVGPANARYMQSLILALTDVLVGMELIDTPQDFRRCASDLTAGLRLLDGCSLESMAAFFEEAASIKESILSGDQVPPSQAMNIGRLSFEEVQERLALVEPFHEPLSQRSHYSNQYPVH